MLQTDRRTDRHWQQRTLCAVCIARQLHGVFKVLLHGYELLCEYGDRCSGCGRITTVGTCTCCLNTCAAVSCLRTCVMPASSPTAPASSTPLKSRPLSTTCTRCPSSTETWSPRISYSTRTDTSSWQTSDSPRDSKTGPFIVFCFIASEFSIGGNKKYRISKQR